MCYIYLYSKEIDLKDDTVVNIIIILNLFSDCNKVVSYSINLKLFFCFKNYNYSELISLFSPKPAEDKPEEDEEVPWSEQAPEILHLSDTTFDEALKEHTSILIMFYAPCMNKYFLFS